MQKKLPAVTVESVVSPPTRSSENAKRKRLDKRVDDAFVRLHAKGLLPPYAHPGFYDWMWEVLSTAFETGVRRPN